MKKGIFTCFLLFLTFSLFSSEDFLKKQGKQEMETGKNWAKELLQELSSGDWDSLARREDLLPEIDKGKEFNPASSSSCETKEFVGSTRKKEQFEGEEELFQPSRGILEDPGTSVGIASSETQEIPEEQKIVTCQEEGTYQLVFTQDRVVHDLPPSKIMVKVCKGHFVVPTDRFFWKSNAEEAAKKLKKELSKDPNIEMVNVSVGKGGGLKDYLLICSWQHKEDFCNCNNFIMEERTVEQPPQEDTWITDHPEGLSETEANPFCRLLYSQVTADGGLRQVDNRPVFRDSWQRQLIFSCEPNKESPCAKLRAQGGILLKKQCLKENMFGECDLWEKTYDLGKRAATRRDRVQFKEDEIWGLGGDFDASYDKNNELAEALSTLSFFSDMQKDPGYPGRKIDKKIEIFRGDKLQCQCSFIQGALYDCCKKMEGVAISAYLAKCTAQEQSLAERRQLGQCHHVGSKKENLDTQTAQVFCCFPTKLARILHEQGREQLQIAWGDAETPECRGFSLGELQKIDFTKIDLSDAVEDISIDRDALLSKVRSTVDHLKATGAEEGSTSTDRAIQSQKDLLK